MRVISLLSFAFGFLVFIHQSDARVGRCAVQVRHLSEAFILSSLQKICHKTPSEVAALSDEERIQNAEHFLSEMGELETEHFDTDQESALLEAHYSAWAEAGLDGTPARLGNFTRRQKITKGRWLRQKFDETQTRLLMVAGFAGFLDNLNSMFGRSGIWENVAKREARQRRELRETGRSGFFDNLNASLGISGIWENVAQRRNRRLRELGDEDRYRSRSTQRPNAPKVKETPADRIYSYLSPDGTLDPNFKINADIDSFIVAFKDFEPTLDFLDHAKDFIQSGQDPSKKVAYFSKRAGIPTAFLVKNPSDFNYTIIVGVQEPIIVEAAHHSTKTNVVSGFKVQTKEGEKTFEIDRVAVFTTVDLRDRVPLFSRQFKAFNPSRAHLELAGHFKKVGLDPSPAIQFFDWLKDSKVVFLIKKPDGTQEIVIGREAPISEASIYTYSVEEPDGSFGTKTVQKESSAQTLWGFDFQPEKGEQRIIPADEILLYAVEKKR